MAVTKRVQTSFRNIMKAKWHFFFKKSGWMYLFGALLLGYGLPLPHYGSLQSGIIYFLILIIVIVIPVYYLTAKKLTHNAPFDADIAFNEQQIVITHRNKDAAEVKEWSWVKNMDITSRAILMEVALPTRFLIILDRKRLTENEWHFFTRIHEHKFLRKH